MKLDHFEYFDSRVPCDVCGKHISQGTLVRPSALYDGSRYVHVCEFPCVNIFLSQRF